MAAFLETAALSGMKKATEEVVGNPASSSGS
jgi:hypothetical protein